MTSARPTISAFVSSLGSVVLLAATWHAAGWAESGEENYPVTSYFVGCIGIGFIAAYLLVSGFLGWVYWRTWPVALGMLAPLPIGVIYECAQDATNHNLIPFEIVLYWVPAFALAFAAAVVGACIRGAPRSARSATHGADAGT